MNVEHIIEDDVCFVIYLDLFLQCGVFYGYYWLMFAKSYLKSCVKVELSYKASTLLAYLLLVKLSEYLPEIP